MNRVTRKKNKDFTIISNVFLRDENLSLKAKGFLAVVMGLSDDWDFTINGICAILKEGKTAVYSTINELKDYGYCTVETCRNDKGMILGNDYTFYEKPYKICPHTEKPNMDNAPQLNTNNINNINNKEDKDKSLSKKEEIDDLFEQCWKAYRRKGSKKNAKQRWDKLNNEDKQKIVAHIPAYISSVSEIKYQRDFERYIKDKLYNNVVYRGNSVLFDPEQLNEIGEYRPKTDGFNLHWIESEKCYMTPFDFDMLNDGYTKDNRPSSAIIMHNGLKYQWDTTIKAWIKL